jgi:arsenite methyltransferase
MQRPDYGYDAPLALAIFALFSFAAAVVAAIGLAERDFRLATNMTVFFVWFLANTLSFYYTTRHGKFLEWARILDTLRLRGDERVLDMGCGRGAVLTAIAKRLATGRVTGVDIWSTQDQSGNAQAVTQSNASLEGVADRVEIRTADMRSLPLPDAAFDLIVSSMAIHNIRGDAGRRKAVAEGFRVLRPGGRMVLVDIRAARAYADELQKLGASDIQRRRLSWRFWWGNPFAATSIVTASKPHH